MSWIAQHWQTIAALSIVAVTVGVFLRRAFGRKGYKSCGGSCGCDVQKPQPDPEAHSSVR